MVRSGKMAISALQASAFFLIPFASVWGEKTKDPPPVDVTIPKGVGKTTARLMDPACVLSPAWVDSDNPAYQEMRDWIRFQGGDLINPMWWPAWWEKDMMTALKFFNSRITMFNSPGCTGLNDTMPTLDCDHSSCEKATTLTEIRSVLLQAINPKGDYSDVNEKGPELVLYRDAEGGQCNEKNMLARAVIPPNTDVACFDIDEELASQVGAFTALHLDICPWHEKAKKEAFWFLEDDDQYYDWTQINEEDAEGWLQNPHAEDMPTEWEYEKAEAKEPFKNGIYEQQADNARQKGKLEPEKNKVYTPGPASEWSG